MSPWIPEDFRLVDGIFAPLRCLMADGWMLFLVSNQPAYAKQQATMENLLAIHRRLDAALRQNGVLFQDYYYCYHHPQGLVPGYSGPCPCRKPSPFLLFKARDEHGVDLARSWMVGDQEVDVRCGQTAGCRTVRVENRWTGGRPATCHPDFVAATLADAVDRIVRDGTVDRARWRMR